MWAALGWGLFAGSSLILGGVLALVFPIRERALGLIMAFGAGVLISAVAYELVAEAFETSAGNGELALGLAAGALTFFVGDVLVDRMGGADRKKIRGTAGTGSALAIVLGIVLDGIPESAVIGLGLLEGTGVSVAVIAAVFLSNLPEAIAATTGLVFRWLEARQDPRPLGGGDARLRARVPAWIRDLRLGGACSARVRARVRGRRDPDHARRHDDARRIRARRQARRAADDTRVRPRLRTDDHRLASASAKSTRRILARRNEEVHSRPRRSA